MANPALSTDNAPLAPTSAAPALQISLESLLILAVLALAVVLRVPELDTVPLHDAEAHEALAGYQRLAPHLPTQADGHVFPLNALGSLITMLNFTLLGVSDFTARLGTALAGVALSLSPLLYRQVIGRTAALLMALGLTISPLAQIAARTSSGMVWALLLVMIGGWAVLRLAETRSRGYAFFATVCAAGVLLLTTPYGLLIGLGLFFGLAWAIRGSDAATRNLVPQMAAAWPGLEGLLAGGIGVAVVATGFFTYPNGLSSIPALIDAFVTGLTHPLPDAPTALPLWVALRYEFYWLLFAGVGVWLSRDESTFAERFLTGWLAWSFVPLIFYVGGTPDLALLGTLPAIGLTVSGGLRLLQTRQFGFWDVPHWAIPLHALAVMGLLVSLGLVLRAQAGQLQLEAKIVDYAEVLNIAPSSTTNVRFGTLQQDTLSSSMSLNLPYVRLQNCQSAIGNRDEDSVTQSTEGLWCDRLEEWTITAQVFPLDDPAQAAHVVLRSIDGDEILPPVRLGDGLTEVIRVEEESEYRLELVRQDEDLPNQDMQYGVVVFAGDVTDDGLIEGISSGGWASNAPQLYAASVVMSRALQGWAIILTLMVLLMLPITFFLHGAFYGARAAWRGLAFGFLGYFLLYGMALGWQASHRYGSDIRELWHTDAAAQDFHTVQAVLEEYSLRDNGTLHSIAVTVQGQEDSALGWALRNFPNVSYVEALGPTTNTAAIIAPDVRPRPDVGASYVGQQLIFDYHWELGWLNWTDFGGWLFNRQTRYEPRPADVHRIWIQQDIYDVERIPES